MPPKRQNRTNLLQKPASLAKGAGRNLLRLAFRIEKVVISSLFAEPRVVRRER
jgi:hypothetical protein